MGLLDVATVVDDDGRWTAGYEIESWGCGLGEYITDLCTPSPIHVAGAEYKAPDGGVPGAVKIVPFGFTAGIARNTRYHSDADVPTLAEYIAVSETPIARVFSQGFAGFSGETLVTTPDAGKPSLTEVLAGADDTATIVALLKAWSAQTTFSYQSAILHLGLTTAFTLPDHTWDVLDKMDIETSISAGYPDDLIAVTGPIVIRLSSIQVLKSVNATSNKVFFEATRLAAIEFDPCLAFVQGS